MATKKVKSFWRNTKGVLSLEASIALTFFIFLMLFMYSFFVVFEARNQIAHVLLTTTDSLALDAFVNETPGESTIQELLYGLYGKNAESNGVFTDYTKWYDGDEQQLQNTIDARFAAYLADGDTTEANRILESLNIVGGFDGLDFSGSHVDGDDLYVVVRYTLEYEFNLFGLGTIEMEQSACSKLWK